MAVTENSQGLIHARAISVFDVAVRTVMVYIHARATSQSLTDVAVRNSQG